MFYKDVKCENLELNQHIASEDNEKTTNEKMNLVRVHYSAPIIYKLVHWLTRARKPMNPAWIIMYCTLMSYFIRYCSIIRSDWLLIIVNRLQRRSIFPLRFYNPDFVAHSIKYLPMCYIWLKFIHTFGFTYFYIFFFGFSKTELCSFF